MFTLARVGCETSATKESKDLNVKGALTYTAIARDHVLYGVVWCCFFFFFEAEDGIRYLVRSRGLGGVYKRQPGAYGR